MHIAIVTAEGFNELDSMVALGILNRAKTPEWRVSICAPSDTITSMNGVTIHATSSLAETASAEVVLFGSSVRQREFVAEASNLAALKLDPQRQLIGAQCSGTLILAKLGLLQGIPACTDLKTKPWVLEAGVDVLDQPFFAAGNIATAGGCLSSQYLATWVIARTQGVEAARSAMHYVAPVGEKEIYVSRALSHVQPYLCAAPAFRAA